MEYHIYRDREYFHKGVLSRLSIDLWIYLDSLCNQSFCNPSTCDSRTDHTHYLREQEVNWGGMSWLTFLCWDSDVCFVSSIRHTFQAALTENVVAIGRACVACCWWIHRGWTEVRTLPANCRWWASNETRGKFKTTQYCIAHVIGWNPSPGGINPVQKQLIILSQLILTYLKD